MTLEFEAEIKLLEGKMKWNVVYFPHSVKDTFGTNGRVSVKISVDDHAFDHTLLPSRNGHYLVYNKIIREKVGKERGEKVRVSLAKADGKRTIEIPNFVKRMLEEAKLLTAFMEQPDYIKREQIQHIVTAKKEETKQARTARLIDRLRQL